MSQKLKIVRAGFDQEASAKAVNLFAKPARTKVKSQIFEGRVHPQSPITFKCVFLQS
ncbi:hypothetical protein H6G17_13335 [Chroococcidiopsis sp. FACHB-1243]|uniref:hypothetical protein n=1 Tax=Chroococcidiopsis sp. [FACHB-1243] TaxID=2692781 RepID=UPI00178251FB|nr:hypothetical protein [Chroococcidiopsis sp. [FACHB-1243]]MBD2306490.1 hypothetical protein [Chroococcidiopsis sp. [FACHB-1243]]